MSRRRLYRALVLAALVGVTPMLAGCESFDLDKWEPFGSKKKMPGERKDLFPGGVPGVSQGVPPEYLQGHAQDQPGAAIASPTPQPGAPPAAADEHKTAAVAPGEPIRVAPQEKAEPKPKPKPKVVKRKPKPEPKVAAPAPQPTAQQQNGPWPAASAPPPGNAAPWPSAQQNSSTEPWPSAPPPGTFSR